MRLDSRSIFIRQILLDLTSFCLFSTHSLLLYNIRYIQINPEMKLCSLILLLGVISHNCATAKKFIRGNYSVNIRYKTLLNIKGKGLESIDLSRLKIERIKPNVFDHLDTKNLNLANNRLTRIPEYLFSNLINLETLSLANNPIEEEFQSGTFFGLKNLKILNLTNTGLAILRYSCLSGIPKSANVIVAGNSLRGIGLTTFEPSIPPETATNVVRSKRSINYSRRPFEGAVELKICKTDNGTVESVSVLTSGQTVGDCLKKHYKLRGNEHEILRLSTSGLSKVLSGWWRVVDDQILQLDLSNNSITEITAELLNELPENVDWVDIYKNRIAMIKSNVINNTNIRILDLGRNNISTIEDGAFEKTQLEILSLTSNNLKNFDFARTLPMTLVRLDVTANAITEIVGDTLTHLKNLRVLSLKRNKINHLSAGAFRGLEKVEIIDLSSNHLEKIESGTFDDLERLASIRLNFNKIRKIQSRVFENVPSLNFISLHNNKIRRISKNSFSALKNKHAFMVDLSLNKINRIEEGSFANMTLRELKLTGNRISEKSIEKGAFDGSAIAYFFLNRNLMTTINGESFYGLSYVSYMTLGKNKIKSIKKGAAKYLGNVTELDLKKNPLKILEKGALSGLSKRTDNYVWFFGKTLQVISAGVFDG